MRSKTVPIMIALAAIAVASPSWAGDLKDLTGRLGQDRGGGAAQALGGAAGNLGLPALGGDVAGNVAGVLGYCIRNNFLGGDVAVQARSRLLSGLGLEEEKAAEEDEDYKAGLSGLLKGTGGGRSLDLESVSGEIRERACDYVLENAGSLL